MYREIVNDLVHFLGVDHVLCFLAQTGFRLCKLFGCDFQGII